MHVPENYKKTEPAAVLVVYNGWGQKPGPGGTRAGAAGLEELTGLSKEADKNGMFVLYMNGDVYKRQFRETNCLIRCGRQTLMLPLKRCAPQFCACAKR